MQSTRRRVIGAALLLTVAVIGSLASAAVAADLFKLLQSSVAAQRVPSYSHVVATARCASGTEVVSGGFAAPDRAYAGGGPYTDTIAAFRSGKGRFTVKAQNNGSPGRIYATAYCGGLGSISVANDATRLGSRKSGSAKASCPAGRIAISGWVWRRGRRRRPRPDGALPLAARR